MRKFFVLLLYFDTFLILFASSVQTVVRDAENMKKNQKNHHTKVEEIINKCTLISIYI